jgi:SRSO17 transposase
LWDHDDLREYVVEHLGADDAVLVVDETGDVKKGTTTVGVQRQYTGTAGRVENAQVAVYMAYAAARGHAFIDRALYLPRSWTDDEQRCAAAGVPAGTPFATKPQLAAQMIARALDAGAPAGWVAADEVYGNDPQLRAMLHQRGVGYLLAVPRTHWVDAGFGPREVAALAEACQHRYGKPIPPVPARRDTAGMPGR